MQSINQLPKTFLERLKTYVPEGKQEEVLQAFSSAHTTTFRINTLKASKEKVVSELAIKGFTFQPVSWYPEACILENKSKQELMETSHYKTGELYIQNLASMIPPLLLSPQSTDTVLDMAASPGSKTTELAALMQNKGTIIANDKSPKRIFKLVDNLKMQGVTNAQTSVMPGEFLWKKYPEYFDKVLIDVPCSMEGRFQVGDPQSYKDWSPRKIKELSNLQKWLLRSAVTCTKVGGSIVYSTCAMDPSENEEVINWILEKTKGAVMLENIDLPGFADNHGLTAWKTKQLSPELSKALRIYPTTLFEGFFVAKLKKISSTLYIS